LELGTWNLELGTWNLELGTWNLELGTWNLELGIPTSGAGVAVFLILIFLIKSKILFDVIF
jgi:1-acyl-sn-glycerol-3-phosphate acyltransferase